MGLKTMSSVAPLERKPQLKIDISEYVGEKASITFNEPRASELYPDASGLKELKRKFPEMPEPMIYQINLLGKCYELDEEDIKAGEVNPTHSIGQLARSHKEMFFFILGEFLAAFSGLDVEERVEEAKNASTE